MMDSIREITGGRHSTASPAASMLQQMEKYWRGSFLSSTWKCTVTSSRSSRNCPLLKHERKAAVASGQQNEATKVTLALNAEWQVMPGK